MKNKEKFPELYYLCKAYFNQSWIDLNAQMGLENPDSEVHVFKAFIKEEKKQLVHLVVSDIEKLIKLNWSEEDLSKLLKDEFDANIHPPSENKTYLLWLKDAKRHLLELHSTTN